MPKAKPDHGSARAPRRARLMARDQAEAFLRALAQGNPAPETELLYTDHFSLLVAVVLSAQTTDAAVNKCTPGLFAAAPTPAAMAALGAEGIAPRGQRRARVRQRRGLARIEQAGDQRVVTGQRQRRLAQQLEAATGR